MLENAEPVMINGEEIPTVIEDDQRIVDPEFIEKHKLTRTKYGQHIEVPINIGNNKDYEIYSEIKDKLLLYNKYE